MAIDNAAISNIVRQVVERQLGPSHQSQSPNCDLPNAATLKQKFRRDQPTYGMWITLESPSITEIATRMGFDWIVIDAEHGYLDMKNVMEHIRVANLANTPILVRISEIQRGLIKRTASSCRTYARRRNWRKLSALPNTRRRARAASVPNALPAGERASGSACRGRTRTP